MQKARQLLGLSVVVTLNLALQFAFQWYVVTQFGAGEVTDAFFGSTALPQFIITVLGGSLSMVLIPLLAPLEKALFQEAVWKHLFAIGILFTSIALLALLTSTWWVKWLLPGFSKENYELAVDLSRIQLIGMIVSAFLSVLWAACTSKERFVLVESTSIVAGAASLVAFMLMKNQWGIYAATWASVLRVVLQVALLTPILGKPTRAHFSNFNYSGTIKKLKPLIAGNLYSKTDMLIDRNLTSRGMAGELTLFNFAQQIFIALNSILVKVTVNTIIPALSKADRKEDRTLFQRLFLKRFFLAALLGIGIVVGLVFVGQPVLHWALSFKHFDAEHVHKLWWILLLMSGLLVGGLLGSLTAGTFYAKGDTRTPTVIGILMFTLYVPAKIYCFHHYGIKGLALSVTCYYMLSAIVQLAVIKTTLFKSKK